VGREGSASTHGGVLAPTDPVHDLEAVQAGQHDIEDHQIGLLRVDDGDSLVPVGAGAGRVARLVEVPRDDLDCGRLVDYDEN
jgi:hypothetical protein